MPEQNDSLIANTKRRMNSKTGATEEIWKEMVYNKDITNDKVNDAYKVWAEAYDKDFAIVHPNSELFNIISTLNHDFNF